MESNGLHYGKEKHRGVIRVALTALCLALAVAVLGGGPPGSGARVSGQAREYTGFPLFFVANHGQSGPEVRYIARAAGLTAYFTLEEVSLRVAGTPVGIRFIGANPSVTIEPARESSAKANFFLGDDPSRWRSNVPTYAAISYRRLYQGIDAVYSGGASRLKSEFVVAPGADPAAVRLGYSGVTGTRITGDGQLVVSTVAGDLREERPKIYQEAGGRRVPVAGGFRLYGENEVGFEVGAYDHARPLVIDPILSYSTYFGGAGLDSAKAIAADANGYAYVTGYTDSIDLPVKAALQTKSGGGVDVFVAKLDVSGNQLVYCTYLGGGWDDRGFGIGVDGSGNAYVTGWTASPNFPTTAGARQRVLAGGRDAFVVKLNPSGSSLVFSTYLGGSSHDSGNAIALDSAGNAYVAGDTYSANFPVLNSFQGSNQGRQDAFVSKLKADGSALLWSTYLGGYGDDYASAIAVDASGRAYVTGGTDSANFPTYSAFQSSNGGGQDAFVTKLNSDGRTLAYSTYLGGSGGTLGANELGYGIAVDAAGNAYVAGITSSSNFPVANALQPKHGGGGLDAFVSKLNPSGTSLIYSTYLGGYGADYAYAIALSPSGAAAVAGYTSSADFPVVGALQSLLAGGYDAFVARLNPQGSALEMATYWGGSGTDVANGLFMDPSGNLYVAGQTISTNFPTKNALQASNTGGIGAFLTKIGEINPTGVFRAANGNTMLVSYGSSILRNAGGTIASDPGMAQNSSGDTYVVGRNPWNQVWMNVYQNDTQTWKGWILAGSPLAGNPAMACLPDGSAYVVARDSAYKYWLDYYRPDTGFQGWISLGGTLVSEPAATWSSSGALYLAGRDSSGVVWGGRYIPVSGFSGWVSAGSSVLAAGRPSITAGTDGAAYVAIRGTNGAVWMGRLQGGTWGSWYSGGGAPGKDPDIAATDGKIYAAITNSTGVVYVQAFTEGTGNGWQGWVYDRGILDKASIAAIRGRYFIIGKNSQKDLWWYQSGGVGWSYLGFTGTAASDPVAGPK